MEPGFPRPTEAPELRRMRQGLARRRREPIRIIVATDLAHPTRTIAIPRSLPTLVLAGSAFLLLSAVVLSLSTWSMSSTVGSLRRRVLAMVQLADKMAVPSVDASQPGLGRRADGQGTALPVRKPSGPQGHVSIEAVNTGEQVDVVLDLATGEVAASSYLALRRLMRCRRTGAETPIDPRLIELLYRLSQRTGQKIELVSGYRAPAFAVPQSYHTRGMAADIRIPGMTALMVRDLARAMGVRGIGYYPRSQFVHVDLREEPFAWTDLGTSEDTGDPEREGNGAEHGTEATIAADP